MIGCIGAGHGASRSERPRMERDGEMAHTTLEEFGPGIWTVSVPLKVAGSEFGTRMTIVRLDAGGLVLIAPCPIDDELETGIRALGSVVAVVAPNCFHHFYFLDALERFPEALAFAAEGVDGKITAMPRGAQILGDTLDPVWKGDLEELAIPGAPKVNETVFFHPASRALILTDFCFNFDPPPGGWTGIFLRLAGAYGRLSVSRLMRSMLKDRQALRPAIEEILNWDFDRIIVTHGQNVVENAKPRFIAATADL